MKRIKVRGLLPAGLLLLCIFSAHAEDKPTPSLTLAPAEIALDVPMPVNSGNLALLLAQAGQGGSLSALKDEALREYKLHLRRTLAEQLQEHFADEEIPLLDRAADFNLHNYLDITVIKHLSDLQSKGKYDLERGTVELTGDFHYRLQNTAGIAVREQRIDLSELRIREKYLVKTPRDGGESEDDTEAAIKRALAQMVEELIERIEDNLQADALRAFAHRP